MNDEESKSDAFKNLLQRRIADLTSQLAAAERHLAELTGEDIPQRGNLRYTHLHDLSDAMVAALKHLGHPAEPLELLRELEIGIYGFNPEDSQTARLANMGRAYKKGGKKRIEVVEGKYQLAPPVPPQGRQKD